MAPSRPKKVGKYDILAELGRGASSIVYLAEDQFNQRKVAVKVRATASGTTEEDARRFNKLFLNEATLVGKLSHPNIVAVYDAVIEPDIAYIVMEYVGVGSLKKYCSETNLLPVRQVVLVIFKAARALDYAFQNGVIHRDIKSANILLDERNDIKISDFGTAHISNSTHTQIDGFVGSPAYMAPEMINEEAPSVQSDIYSLGVTMYELLVGRLPFVASNSVALINKILHDEPVSLRVVRNDLPDKLVQIVERAMCKDPAKRFSSWYEMARELASTFPQLEQDSAELSATERFNALRRLGFFQEFRDSEIYEVLRSATWETHARDQNLLLEGDVGRAFFIIIAGKVKVMKDDRLLGTLGDGDCFGEMAYLSGDSARRTASIIATTEVVLLRVQDVRLEQLSESCQLRFNRKFLHTLIDRLANTSQALVEISSS